MPTKTLVETPKKTEGRVKIEVRRSKAGLGVFALERIEKGQEIIEYVGRKITVKEGDALENNRYVINVNSRYDIDGSPRFNTARYINHSCKPNCEALSYRGRVFVHAKRTIQPGEELTYDYGKWHFEGFIKPKGCKCVKCDA